MNAHLHRRYHFSASHRLHADSLSDAENNEVYGKCNNPFGHGHNYSVEVTVSGPIHPVTGMVINLADLDAIVNEEIVRRFDHVNLNTLEDFVNTVPTTESLTREVFRRLRHAFPHVTLEQVKIEETSNNTFAYAG